MEERIKKAFDFAADGTKQLITLSTGIVTLMITFSKDVLGGAPAGARILLIFAWVIYLLSITCGVWTLLALTGSLEPAQTNQAPPASIRGRNVTLPSIVQILLFVLATALTVAFGIWGAFR